MGYELRAVIADEELLRAACRGLPDAGVARLNQGLGLLPLTYDLTDAVEEDSAAAPAGLRGLPNGFDRVLAAWSAAGPIAYVEADYHGGTGSQSAAVWTDGRLTLGPTTSAPERRDTGPGGPISRALACLGISVGDSVDEFAAAGLHRERRTEDWPTSRGPSLPGSTPDSPARPWIDRLIYRRSRARIDP